MIVSSPADLDKVVLHFFRHYPKNKKIALYGDLGSGKTTLVRAFCRHLRTTDAVASPTFAIVNEYQYQDENGVVAIMYHLDLYRLNRLQEALDIGIEDYLSDDNLCFIEWPEIIENLLPPDTVRIKIDVGHDNSRKITFL